MAALVLLGSLTMGSDVALASERGGLAGFFDALFGRPREVEAPQPEMAVREGRSTNRALKKAARSRARHKLAHATPPVHDRGQRHVRPRAATAAVAHMDGAHPAAGEVAQYRSGDRTVCVRTCDGYLFPLGALHSRSDIPLHENACANSCPNAQTSLYTLAAGETELDHAVGLDGTPYKASPQANVFRERRVANCSCQGNGTEIRTPIASDNTLRKGDVIATSSSAEVVTHFQTGRPNLKDYRYAAIPSGQVRAIEGRFGTIRREAEANSFRRLLRSRSTTAVAVAEEPYDIPRPAVMRLRMRIVTPSPFEH